MLEPILLEVFFSFRMRWVVWIIVASEVARLLMFVLKAFCGYLCCLQLMALLEVTRVIPGVAFRVWLRHGVINVVCCTKTVILCTKIAYRYHVSKQGSSFATTEVAIYAVPLFRVPSTLGFFQDQRRQHLLNLGSQCERCELLIHVLPRKEVTLVAVPANAVVSTR